MSSFLFDEQEIRKAVAILHPDENKVFEVRFLDGKKIWAGVFKDADTLIETLQNNSMVPYGATGYITLNKLDEACYARSHQNKIMYNPLPMVSDDNALHYFWFLIDLDPVRISGISSTNDELILSQEKAKEIMEYLKNRGWPDPVVARSGNGTHLLYRIYFKCTPEAKKMVDNALKALDLLFGDDKVHVDLTVGNPGQITKLYGTVARKGADTPERPHRWSKLLLVPEKNELVPMAYLESLAQLIPQPEKPQKYNKYNPSSFDLREWLDEHGVQTGDEIKYKDGIKWFLDHCPFNSEHKGRDAAVFQMSNGAVGFHCYHNSCAGYHWRDFRLFYEPDAYKPKEEKAAVPNYLASKPENFGKKNAADMPDSNEPYFRTTEEIRQRVVPDEAHIMTGIDGIDTRMIGLKKGYVSVLSGLRSAGKSSLLSQLVLNCRQQGMKCAFFSGESNDKTVLKWLQLQAAGKNHVHGTQYEKVFYPNDEAAIAVSQWLNDFVYIYNNDKGNQFAAIEEQLHKVVSEKKLDLVLLDNLMALDIDSLDKDQYIAQKKFVNELKRIAVSMNIHILFVAHPRKSLGYLRMNDISGSADLSNAADNVFIIHRVDEDYKHMTQQFLRWKDSNPIYKADNVIEICKDRDLGNRDEHVPLYFEKETKRLRNTPTEYIHYGWEDNFRDKLTGMIQLKMSEDELPFNDGKQQ